MKRTISALLALTLLLSLTACGPKEEPPSAEETVITLSDDGVQVNGAPAPGNTDAPVFVGGDIIYYQDGTGSDYGEGEAWEMHTAEEAEAHTVVTITQPGTYRVSGTLSKGQLFIDLGEEAESDPDAVVTVILDNADITCTVAPAVLFYRVFECGSDDPETAGPVVDTAGAGANVVLTAGSQNHITGSHVAKIYQEGTDKKLHKYDGAFYSRMSMNIDSEPGDAHGALYITGDYEGLDSELHLTINGGVIFVDADNDGINTNEDGVSVTTINGGMLTVNGGLGEEGDGIDSNGYITINGGTVWATSNEQSPDGGIDADMDITINGGSVIAFGTRNDSVAETSAQPSMELNFAQTLPAGTDLTVLDENGDAVFSLQLARACQSVTLSDATLVQGTDYQVQVNGVTQSHSQGGFDKGRMGEAGDPPAMPEGMEPPEGMEGQPPERPTQDPDARPTPPEGMEPPADMGQPPEGGPMSDRPMERNDGEVSTVFTLTDIAARFQNVRNAE